MTGDTQPQHHIGAGIGRRQNRFDFARIYPLKAHTRADLDAANVRKCRPHRKGMAIQAVTTAKGEKPKSPGPTRLGRRRRA